MSAEKYRPEKQPDFLYYTADREQFEKIEEELFFQGFTREDCHDPEGDEVVYYYVDENGYGILASLAEEVPESYILQVDRGIANLLNEMLIDIKMDNDLTEYANQVYKYLVPKEASSNPEYYARILESLPQDIFTVWEDKKKQEIESLREYLKVYYPNLVRLTKTDGEENFDVYKETEYDERGFIVITRQVNTANPEGYRVKATENLAPVLEGFWGSENSPPISF